MKELWVKVFKTGKHTDSKGNTKEWSEDDLKSIVETYNNQPENSRHDASLRPADHNESYVDSNGKLVLKPSFGYVKGLKYDEGTVYANVLPSPELIDGVRNNRYKKLSIGLKNTDDGKKLLDHIAILGSVNPAVKGLGMLEMTEEAFSEFEMTEEIKKEREAIADKYGENTDIQLYEDNLKKGILTSISKGFSSIADTLESLFTKQETMEPEKKQTKQDKEDKQFNINSSTEEFMDEESIKAIVAKVKEKHGAEVATSIQAMLSSISGGDKKKGDSADGSQMTDKKADVQSFKESEGYKAMQKKIAELEEKNRRAEFNKFLDKNRERITPAMRPFALELMEQMHDKNKIQYSEKGEAKEISGVELIEKLVSAIPEQVKLGSETELIGYEQHEDAFSEINKQIEERNKSKEGSKA